MEGTIRGCHPNVTPIVLPETLPNHVSDSLVTRFRAHLSGQLRHLLSFPGVTVPGKGHRHNTSESAYSSTSSTDSTLEIQSEEHNNWLKLFRPESGATS